MNRIPWIGPRIVTRTSASAVRLRTEATSSSRKLVASASATMRKVFREYTPPRMTNAPHLRGGAGARGAGILGSRSCDAHCCSSACSPSPGAVTPPRRRRGVARGRDAGRRAGAAGRRDGRGPRRRRRRRAVRAVARPGCGCPEVDRTPPLAVMRLELGRASRWCGARRRGPAGAAPVELPRPSLTATALVRDMDGGTGRIRVSAVYTTDCGGRRQEHGDVLPARADREHPDPAGRAGAQPAAALGDDRLPGRLRGLRARLRRGHERPRARVDQ